MKGNLHLWREKKEIGNKNQNFVHYVNIISGQNFPNYNSCYQNLNIVKQFAVLD